MLLAWIPPPVFFLFILVLVVASQVFWFRRARSLVRRCRVAWQRWCVAVPLYGWFCLLGVLVLLVPLRLLLADGVPASLSLFMVVRHPVVLIPVGLWLMASFLSFVLIVLVRGTTWLFGRWLRPRGTTETSPEQVLIERRYFLQATTYAAGALPFVFAGYGFLIGRQNYRVQEVNIRIPGLSEGLDGLRLLQLTDVHASAYMPVKEIRRVVGLASELDADLVFHTGDFITGRGDPLAEAIAELARVHGHSGSFGCLGNHEDYAKVANAATELCGRHGIRILRGENTELEIRGARLNLIGVNYQRHLRGPGPHRSKRYFLRGVEKLIRPGAFNILLCHNPNPFVRAAELGVELTLAGHTHGGQVQVEILDSRWNPSRFITPFISGLYEWPRGLSSTQLPGERCFLYVSRGIGTVAAPVRLNAPPEISLLILRRA